MPRRPRREAPEQASEEAGPAQPGSALRTKAAEEGPPMTMGYGLNGASVQVSSPPGMTKFKHDRELVRYTVLRGTPEVRASQ
eukprot:375529-Lingulodinium_polyedra.AAC.1